MTERPRADRSGASEGREPQGPEPSAPDDGRPPRRALEEPAEQGSWQSAGQPEREKRAERPSRRRRPRRAVRGGTNPSAEDVPDVVAPRDAPAPEETQHDRWLREQRPPHWE